jgi:hypothetical protein
MKRIFIYLSMLLVVVIGFGVTGCYKNVISPESDPDGPPQSVSFKNDLAPLFQSNCALSGCHVSGAHHPYMTSDVSYQQIVNGGYVNIVVPKASILYQKVNGEMSEYIPSKSDKQKVYDWIRNGAPNN